MEEVYYTYLKKDQKAKLRSKDHSELKEILADIPFRIRAINDLKNRDPDVQKIKQDLGKVKRLLKDAEESYVTDIKKQKEIADFVVKFLEDQGVEVESADVYKEVEQDKEKENKDE